MDDVRFDTPMSLLVLTGPRMTVGPLSSICCPFVRRIGCLTDWGFDGLEVWRTGGLVDRVGRTLTPVVDGGGETRKLVSQGQTPSLIVVTVVGREISVFRRWDRSIH